MFALPEQTPEQAVADLQTAIALGVEHLSWYQLTLEPNTPFYTNPPPIPDDDRSQDIYEAGISTLTAAGFRQYETSAWTRGAASMHNLNYWQYGDYLGIGAGAHGKRTTPDGQIIRNRKYRSPSVYQQGNYEDARETIAPEEQAFEFMMNALRLKAGVPRHYLEQRTALHQHNIQPTIDTLTTRGLLADDPSHYRTTEQGFAFLNDVISAFLPEQH